MDEYDGGMDPCDNKRARVIIEEEGKYKEEGKSEDIEEEGKSEDIKEEGKSEDIEEEGKSEDEEEGKSEDEEEGKSEDEEGKSEDEESKSEDEEEWLPSRKERMESYMRYINWEEHLQIDPNNKAMVQHHSLILAKQKKDIEMFEEMKKRSLFKNQHWHMVEVQEEETAELLLIWDRRLDDMCYFGERTNTLTETRQIYSLKLICNDDDGEDYSLDVFGQLCLVLSTYVYPYRRVQVIFCRPRDKSQILTKKDPYLRLTGPDRHPTINGDLLIEARLILKGSTKSEDKYLSLSTACKLYNGEFVEPDVSRCCKKGKLCAGVTDTGKHYCLEMTRSIVTYVVVATIDVQIDGSGQLLQGRFLPGRYFFTAYASKDELSPCDDDMKVVLLDSRGDKVPVEVRNRFFVLSRRTICVNKQTESLMVSIEQDGNVKLLKFTPGYEGVEKASFDIGSCKMQVKVKWSIYWEKYGPKYRSFIGR